MRYIVVLDGSAYGLFDTVAEAADWVERNGFSDAAIICTFVKVR